MQLPAPHKESNDVVQSSTTTTIDYDLESKSNIPLPSVPIADEPKIAEIPVLPELDTSPSLPDLTDLFEDETADDKVVIESVEKQDFIETPDLPDLDDLF